MFYVPRWFDFKIQSDHIKRQDDKNYRCRELSECPKDSSEEDPFWRGKGNRFMKKKIKYTNEKIGRIEVVKDFLPSPDELAFKESNVKVTLNLSKSSVEFFKQLAKDHGSQYQKVIRDLLDGYSSHYSSKP